MIWVLSLLVCLFSADARYQPEDWVPTLRTIENGYDNISSTSDSDILEMFLQEDPTLEELERFIPSDFESEIGRAEGENLYKQVDEFLQGPLNTFKEINTIGSSGISSAVHESISYLYVKLFTYFVRAYAWMSRSLVASFIKIRGNLCYKIPNIEKFFKFFTLIGGEVCPFDDFEMQNVTVKKSADKWIVELPVVVRKVKVVFTSIQLYTPLLSSPSWTFEAKDILVKITLGMAKSLVPYPTSIDFQVKVEGCKFSDADSNWIIRKLLKLTSKICDPIINEIIKISLFVMKLDFKMLAWFAKKIFNGDKWIYTVVEWVLRQLHNLVQSKIDQVQ